MDCSWSDVCWGYALPDLLFVVSVAIVVPVVFSVSLVVEVVTLAPVEDVVAAFDAEVLSVDEFADRLGGLALG